MFPFILPSFAVLCRGTQELDPVPALHARGRVVPHDEVGPFIFKSADGQADGRPRPVERMEKTKKSE